MNFDFEISRVDCIFQFITLKEYRRKIDLLEQAEQEKETLKDENFRLRDEMQSR